MAHAKPYTRPVRVSGWLYSVFHVLIVYILFSLFVVYSFMLCMYYM
jgi:hypothetical protein